MRHEDIPDINNPYIMTSTPTGDTLINDVLNGGYNVQPVPPPNSPVTDNITKIYDNGNIKIDILFTLGYTTSGAPKNKR